MPSASLQTPFLLTIALAVSSYLKSFPFSPRPTFRLLRKLDLIFSSLLQGVNAETGLPLSGFESGRGNLSTTEKVRLKGIVETSRIAIVDVAGRVLDNNEAESSIVDFRDTDDEPTTDSMNDMKEEGSDEGQGGWEMKIARVYENTIIQLGASLNSENLAFG